MNSQILVTVFWYTAWRRFCWLQFSQSG